MIGLLAIITRMLSVAHMLQIIPKRLTLSFQIYQLYFLAAAEDFHRLWKIWQKADSLYISLAGQRTTLAHPHRTSINRRG